MYNRILEIIVDICQEEIIKSDPDINLIESDLIDSMAFIEIISTLEDEFEIQIQPTQVPYEVWSSVEKITKFVESKINEKENGE